MSKQQNLIQDKKNALQSMSQARKNFNIGLMRLINISHEKNKNDENIAVIKDLYKTVLSSDPEIIIKKAGPYIWKYREEISKKDENFFLKNNFNSDVQNLHGKISDSDVNKIIISFKNIWKTLSNPEKQTIWNLIGSLLLSYAQFVGSERKLINVRKQIKQLNQR